MRVLLVAGLIGLAGAAQGQDRVVVRGPGAGYPPPGPMVAAPLPPAPAVRVGDGAPGGYAAYRRPVRGFVLPAYWNAPSFRVDDWRGFELPEPPLGCRWVRYYDDAVLIDPRGSVYDVEPEVAWDRFERGYDPGALSPYVGGYAPTYTVAAGETRTVFAGPGVTTVTVSTQPAVTMTTTTEYRDEAVTYTRPATWPRRVDRTKLRRR